MRKNSLKLSLSLAGVLLLGGACLLASPLDYLKSLNLAPKTASLGKPEKIDIHSIHFLKYPILSNEKEIGYVLCDEKGKIEEFSLSGLEKLAKIKSFPHLNFFLNSHSTASASLLATLGFRGNEPEKVFIASLNVFIEKCLCNLPGKPLVYDIKRGLEDFAKYKGKNVEVKEVYRFGSEENALQFYKREIDERRAVVVSFVYDKEGRKRDRARERRETDSYLGIGYIPKTNFLILYDGRKIIAKNYDGDYSNLIVLGARVK